MRESGAAQQPKSEYTKESAPCKFLASMASAPLSRQPLKAIYILLRVLALFPLIPFWAFSSLISRPRASWTIKECVSIRLVHWMMPLNARCGISPLCTDKTREVPQTELKETSFVWLEPISDSLITGIAVDEKVKPVRIPGYIWPKNTAFESGRLVGLFIHGGGYMMGNGSESFDETNIARLVYQKTKIKHILSLDYRLSGEASHPAQLLDALAAYAHLVNTLHIQPTKIVVFGACAGGHLALLLLRYLYEEKVLPMPAAMMLFSPWVDMVIDEDIESGKTGERPNTSIDLLATSFAANLRFLGHAPRSLLATPYLSGNRAPPNAYKGYPPTFVSVGDAEAFRRECEQLVELMRTDGVDVELDVQEDAVHDFLGFSIVPSNKARENVMVRVQSWVDAL
ncbi:Alpha/Beta hydrolase protein [Mycena latifolia]|nr:Alpha/Beta hydrolase protein [Mycena latifolia]